MYLTKNIYLRLDTSGTLRMLVARDAILDNELLLLGNDLSPPRLPVDAFLFILLA